MIVNPVVSGGGSKTYSITLAPGATGIYYFPGSAEAGAFVSGSELSVEIGGPRANTASGKSVPMSRFTFVMPSEDVIITRSE